jgi:predicted Ser/Thr protein kinase
MPGAVCHGRLAREEAVSTGDNTRIGTEIAGYRVESLLGRGGMSVVYLAEHVRLGRRVALKLLAPMLSDDETYRDRFQRESRRAAELDHPNVVPIFDAGEVDGQLFIAMRYIEGCDLKTLIRREGQLGMGRTLFILEQAADGLDAAHERNLIHRDVKPGNILIAEPSEQVYLTDFGVVKHTASKGLTRTGFFIGTVDYAAPEQIEGLPVDARTDVYALGCVLYECLVGKAPFDRDAEINVMHAHLIDAPPLLTASRPDLPKALNRVLASALAKAKDDRYDTCGQLIEAARVAARQRSTTTVHRDGEDAGAVGAEAPAAASVEMATTEPPTPALSDAGAAVIATPVTGDSDADALSVEAEVPPAQPAGAPPQPPASGDGGVGRRRDGRTWLAAGAVVVAALLAAAAVYAVMRDSNSGTGITTGTTQQQTGPVAPLPLLSALMPSDIAAQCKTQQKASYGAVETVLCHPPANAPTSFPQEYSFSFFRTHAALRRSFDDVAGGLALGFCGSTRGQEAWIHKSTGKAGGVRVCGNAVNGDAMIVWTHEKNRSPDHVDMLGVARASGRGADLYRSWWGGAVKNTVGKCRPLLPENVCFATVRHFEQTQ